MPVQSGFGSTTLDFLCCIDGWFIAVETKAPGKQLTPRQVATAEFIKQAGGRVFIVDSQASCDFMLADIHLMKEFATNARPNPFRNPLLLLGAAQEQTPDE